MNGSAAVRLPWMALAAVVLLFTIYSFLGWVIEVAYAAFDTGKLTNRGFLNGPVCPIYGAGMLALLLMMRPVGDAPLAQFVVGMAVTTGIELVGGWALYKVFHTRWWDYSMYRFNLGGFICLRFSLAWGAGSLVMVRVVHPLVMRVVTWVLTVLPAAVSLALAAALAAGFAVDVALSAAAAVGLNRYLSEIDALRGRMRVVSDALTEAIGGRALSLDELLDEKALQLRLGAMEGRDNLAELRAQLADLAQRSARRRRMGAGTRRLLRAFPEMHSEHFSEALAAVQRHLRR